MDELLAGAERVDARPHTVRRALGLATTLIVVGVSVAVVVSGTAYGLWAGFWRFAITGWSG